MGSVSPCSTSVAITTQNVRKVTRSRPGKPTGSAYAAAIDTTPRMPAQPTTTGIRHDGAGSRSRSRRDSRVGR